MNEKKTVLITGATGGIGQAIVKELANSKDYRLALHYHQKYEMARELVTQLREEGIESVLVQADLSNSSEVHQLFDKIETEFGSVSTLIHTTGSSKIHLLQDLTDHDWNQLVADNLTSCVYTCRRAIKPMIKNQEGKIITISSMWGLVGASCETAYSALKAGVIGFTKALAQELAPSHIRVNCVAPGAVQTTMLDCYDEASKEQIAKETPLGYIASPEEIAKTITFLSGSGGDFYTGQVLSPNGGLVIS